MEYLALIPSGVLILLWYLLQQKDARQQKDIDSLSESIKRTADAVMLEREKAAALVMSEKEKLAALVKTEHDRLREEFTVFRIRVAEDYATTNLVEKVLKPIIEKLNHIESLLPNKLDRREFDAHKEETTRGKQ